MKILLLKKLFILNSTRIKFFAIFWWLDFWAKPHGLLYSTEFQSKHRHKSQTSDMATNYCLRVISHSWLASRYRSVRRTTLHSNVCNSGSELIRTLLIGCPSLWRRVPSIECLCLAIDMMATNHSALTVGHIECRCNQVELLNNKLILEFKNFN